MATKGEEEVRQKTMLAYASGTWGDMADVISTFPVSMQAMAEAGVLMDVTLVPRAVSGQVRRRLL